MGVSTILTSEHVRIADEFYALELWRSQNDPPYYAVADLPRYEGGVVGSVSGTDVTLSLVRQAINPSTRDASFETAFTVDHVGRYMLVLTGTLAGEAYLIVETPTASGDVITVEDGSDLTNLAAGDYVAVADKIDPVGVSCTRGIDDLMAGFSLDYRDDGTGDRYEKLQAMSWVYWRKKLWDDTETSGWVDIGHFCLDGAVDEIHPRTFPISVEGRDALKWLDTNPYSGIFEADKIPAHDRIGTGSLACVNLKMVDESGTSGSGVYRFFDSPESGSDAILANHTSNWAVIPPPTVYHSDDQNATISGDDTLIDITNDAVEVLYGSGEIRVQAKYYQEKFSGSENVPEPYVKIRYSRYATYKDALRGTVTALSGTGIMFDTNVIGTPLAFPTAGYGLRDMTVRFTSGSAVGRTFSVDSNSSGSLTFSEDLSAAGVTVGTPYELADINDPMRIIEDVAAYSGFHRRDAALPMYMAPFDDILIPDQPALVYQYDASDVSYTDITDAVADESSTTNLLGALGDIVYVGHNQPFTRLNFKLTAFWEEGQWTVEYWNGSEWTQFPTYGYTDATSQFTATGQVKWNMPSNWRVSTVNGSSYYFWARVRVTTPAVGTATVKRIQIVERIGAKSPTEYKIEEMMTPSKIVSDLRGQRLIPPNWILYAAADGTVHGEEITQNSTADWELVRKTGVRRERNDDEVYTGVFYRGWSDDQSSIRVSNGTVTIGHCTELDMKLSGSGYPDSIGDDYSVELAHTNDTTAGIGLIIDGIDKRDIEYIANPWRAGRVQRWGYITRRVQTDTSPYWADLDNLPLWYVDLGELKTSVAEVRIVIDGATRGEARWVPWGYTAPPPIVSLEVASGDPPYSGLVWSPLCNRATAITIDTAGTKEYTYSKGDEAWQQSWRYLRYKCISGGRLGTIHAKPFADSGAVVELKIYENQELNKTLWLGTDTPFTAATYQNRIRRYGKRLYVVSDVDYSASTDEKVRERAVEYLKELSYELPEVSLDGVRPDAQLYQTLTLNQTEFGYTNRSFLITGQTIGKGSQISLTAQDFSISTS